jgi:myo-inositol-1(or 4)-monophosphatase
MDDVTLLAIAMRAAEAGASVLRRFEIQLGAERPSVDRKKSSIDLVTHVDRESEAAIMEVLVEAGIAIVAEEGSHATGSEGAVFYVDPLDGTTNFAHGHPFHCVSIGLHRHGSPVLGVIAAPMLGVVWSGGPNLPTTRDDRVHGVKRPLVVSETDSLGDALFATGFPYDRRTSDDDNLAAHRALSKLGQGVLRCGSAALDLALVADGTYDAYWERKLGPWDLTAGAALVMAAGGRVTGVRGEAFSPTDGHVAASNGVLHRDLLGALKPVIPASEPAR